MKKIICFIACFSTISASFSQDLLIDIIPGIESSNPQGFYSSKNGKVYFSAIGADGFGKIYVTNGSPSTTHLINADPDVMGTSILGEINNEVYFMGQYPMLGSIQNIYKTNGTEGDIEYVANFTSQSEMLVALGHPINYVMNDILYFIGSTSITGFELMRTDGTEEGTYIVKDIYEGVGQHTKNQRTNSTFGFLPTQKPTLKNQKSCFLPTL